MDKNRYIEPHMESNGREKRLYALCALLAFAGAACGVAYCNLKTAGSIYLQSDDGDLYLSIARNLLENAHFIQTARTVKAFVVPPGLPFMCTLLLFFFGRLSEFLVGSGFAERAIGAASPDMLGLLGFQYLVYGSAAACMAMSALKLAFSGLNAAVKGIFAWQKGKVNGASASSASATIPEPVEGTALPWIFSVLIGAIVPACYIWCSVKIRHPNPGFILTENYVVCLIAFILWLVVKDANPKKITAAAFVLMLFRPACSLLLIAAFLWMVIRAFSDRIGKKMIAPDGTIVRRKLPIRERVHFGDILVMLLVFACVIGVNTGVNWVETGEIIPLEDYGSLDLFLANNEKAPADWYHSGKVPEFASTEYYVIADNGGLTRYEQNKLAGEALREYVSANRDTVINNALIRFQKLFCETWGPVFYAFLACLLIQFFLKGLRWPQKVYIFLMAVFLAVPPAFGLLVARYSAPMLPLFIALIVGTAGQIIGILAMLPKKEAVEAAVPAEKTAVTEAKPKEADVKSTEVITEVIEEAKLKPETKPEITGQKPAVLCAPPAEPIPAPETPPAQE